MRNAMISISVLAGELLCCGAPAQIPPETTAGMVQAVSASGVTVQTKLDQPVSFDLTERTQIIFSRPGTAADIKPGSFIGTTNMPTADGVGRSTEVHILPPGLKIGEGDRPMGSRAPAEAAGARMTNGTVAAGTAAAPQMGDGATPRMTNGSVGSVSDISGVREFDVDYAGGRRHIVVSSAVPVVVMRTGTLAELKPGAKVVVGSGKAENGHHDAIFISVQR